MSSAAVEPRHTPAQYLAMERESSHRSEYIDGYIYAMAGASRQHNLIAGNLFGEIRQQLKGRACEVYTADMRVRVGASRRFTYPDVVAVCGEPVFDDDHLDTLLNPTVIVEVLSPSTEVDDRGWKFADYRRLSSLQEYILVAQDRVSVERYVRQGDFWLLSEMVERDDVLEIGTIHCHLPLQDIYDRVEFEDRPAPPRLS